MGIADHIVRVTAVGADLTALDFNGRQWRWSDLGRAIEELSALLRSSGVRDDQMIGLLGRNRPEPLAAFIAVLGSAHALLLVNALRSPAKIAEELRELRLACLIAAESDLGPELLAAIGPSDTMFIAVRMEGERIEFRALSQPGAGPHRARGPGMLIEMQTSGTTGVPKRVAVTEAMVEASLRDGVRRAAGAVEQQELTPKSSPTLMFGPLVHLSGTFNMLMSVFEARPIVLFEKFDAEEYRKALARYRPKFAALPPTALKMMLDSSATREDFSSVAAARAGTAPLPVDLQLAFEEKFGVPVLTTYGATEFMGAIASWTLDEHRRFAATKRGSAGRAGKGVTLRIVDPATGVELACGATGLLEAKVERIDGGKAWIRTTDLAKIDEQGFLFILGRADDAINRGGFKIMAGRVSDVLRQYPGIYDVIVVGRPDERLGEVPVAVLEPYPDAAAIDIEALRAFAKERLNAYEVPVRFHLVKRLPRNVSDKISRPEIKALLDSLDS